MPNLKEILEHLIKMYPELEHESGLGANLAFPDFDLLPQDYLKFAEDSLKGENSQEKINCVSNLKRAMECEMDTFFHVLGILPLFKKRNLGFDKKLEFIGATGLYKSTSLETLNTIRNKIEHEYIVPELEEIALYFELVYAFISVVEGALFMLSSNAEIEYSDNSDKENKYQIAVKIKYIFETQQVIFEFIDKESEAKNYKAHSYGTNDIAAFAAALASYFWLVRGISLFGNQYVCTQLSEISKNL